MVGDEEDRDDPDGGHIAQMSCNCHAAFRVQGM